MALMRAQAMSGVMLIIGISKATTLILKSMNLIEVINNPKKENDYYIKLNKNINESET